jgi:hypothetical protein
VARHRAHCRYGAAGVCRRRVDGRQVVTAGCVCVCCSQAHRQRHGNRRGQGRWRRCALRLQRHQV